MAVGLAHGRMNEEEFNDGDEDSPKIVSSSYFRQTFSPGNHLEVFCEARGTPVPSITWYADGRQVATDFRHTIRYEVYNDTIRSFLRIFPATVGNKGTHECLATNIKGAALKKLCLDIKL